jgi:hypothetical protein
VRDREVVLVLIAGQWKQGRVRLLGDGARKLSSPVIALPSRRYLEIDVNTRVRLKRRA